jgi:hypothetical protein
MSTTSLTPRLFPLPNNSMARREFLWQSATPLPEPDQSALNVGAHQCSRFNNWACDTLDIAQDRDEARQNLKDAWGITNTTEARQSAGRLLDGMHSASYELVFPLLDALVSEEDGHSPEVHRSFLALRAQSRGEHPSYWISVYEALYQLRTVAKPFSGFVSPTWPTHIRAWDFARLPFVVRSARCAGYLDDGESWAILHANLSAARSYYPNWRMFAQGVIIGRMYWRALTDVAAAKEFGEYAASAINALLIRPDSPWLRRPLHPASPAAPLS